MLTAAAFFETTGIKRRRRTICTAISDHLNLHHKHFNIADWRIMLKRLNSSDTKNLNSVRFVFMSYQSDICVQFVSARHKDLIGKLMKRIRVKPWTKSGLIGFIVRVYATAGEEYSRGEKAWQFNWQFAVGSGNHRRTVPCYCSFQGSLKVPKMEFFIKLKFEIWVFYKYAKLSFL